MKALFRQFGPLLLILALLASAVVFVDYKYVWWTIAGQDPVESQALTGEYEANQTQGEFLGQRVSSFPVSGFPLAVLGASNEPKHIEVDLTTQRLFAYEGDKKVFEFKISSGKWGRTPTGTFRIWGKFKYTKMSGGNRALHTYYYLPNVPYVMFFSNSEVAAGRGFSLHGTYWHDNFGQPMSHGCVNMRTEDAKTMFYWTQPMVASGNTARSDEENPGTEIIIYGTAPRT